MGYNERMTFTSWGIHAVRLGLVLGALFWAALASASDVGSVDIRGHIDAGRYDEAITAGQTMGSPEGLVLAAEALSTKVMLGYVDDHVDESKQARKWAQAALEQNPSSHDALLQYALAYGFETRSSSPFRAWRKKLPAKTRDAIDALRAEYPDDPRGDALLAAWHLGIIRKTGDANGEKWFDASQAEGIRLYEAALAAAPNDIVIASNYALSLLAIDADQHMERGRELVAVIDLMKPRNATEQEVQSRMKHILNYEDMDDLNDRVEALLDGK